MLIPILAIFIILLGWKFDLVKKKSKNFFQLKNLNKIIILALLFITIYIILCYGSQQIVKYLRNFEKYANRKDLGYLTPYLWFRFLNITIQSKNQSLNQIYLLNTSLLCLSSIPFFVYMLKASKEDLDTDGTARWAKISEWDKAGYIAPVGKFTDGVILGRTNPQFGGLIPPRVIIDKEKTHIALVAPTRSGKGVGVIIPTLLNWSGSVFVLDMKGENYQITAGYRKEVLKQVVLKFQPYGLKDCVSYNPLVEVRIGTPYEVKDATIIADILTDPGEGKKRDHWDLSASALSLGLILHVLYVRKKEGKIGTFGDIVDFLTSTEKPLDENFASLLNYKHLKDEDLHIWNEIYDTSQTKGVEKGTHPVVARMAAEILNKDERERASIISTLMAKLSLFKDPIVRKNTSRADFRIKDLMDYKTPVSFYIVVTAEEMKSLAPLLRILVTQTIGVLAPEMDFSSDAAPHLHKLLFLMDEFPAFGTIPLFEEALAYIAGYGMKALIIAQALNQIKKNYGDKNSVFDNCATAVFYSPTPLDNETPRQISDLLGDTTISTKSKSYQAFSIGKSNISVSNKSRKLLTPEEVRNKLGDKRNIISIAGLYPMMGNKIRYFEEKYFTSKTHKVYGIPKTDYLYEEATINTNQEVEEIKEQDIEELKEDAMKRYLEDTENEEIVIIENDDFSENDIIDNYLSEENLEGMLETLSEDNEEGIIDPEEDF